MKNLKVILIHGTWGAGAEWANEGSEFQTRLSAELDGIYAKVRYRPFAWNAQNRWRARTYVAAKLDSLLKAEQ